MLIFLRLGLLRFQRAIADRLAFYMPYRHDACNVRSIGLTIWRHALREAIYQIFCKFYSDIIHLRWRLASNPFPVACANGRIELIFKWKQQSTMPRRTGRVAVGIERVISTDNGKQQQTDSAPFTTATHDKQRPSKLSLTYHSLAFIPSLASHLYSYTLKFIYIPTLSMAVTHAKTLRRADPTTIQDKFLVGYQGWFTCAGDGRPVGPGHHGWLHWFNYPIPDGGRPNTDLWPDTSEYSPSELFPAPGLKYANGEQAFLFSSRHRKTVNRHFNWMAMHGVDGAFLQRFVGQCDLDGGNEGIRNIRDEVGDRVREAAEQEGRVFAIMCVTLGFPIYSDCSDDVLRLILLGTTSQE